MVYLVGVDHLVQYDGPLPHPIREEFRSYLVRLCADLGIDAIAEEFSDYALREVYHATADTAQEAAQISGILHRYCDPGGKELHELGIPGFGDLLEEAKRKFNAPSSYILDKALRKKVTSYAADRARSYWDIREKYWLDRLKDILDKEILFLCGHEHVDRFKALLRKRGCDTIIIEPFWNKDLFRDYNAFGL